MVLRSSDLRREYTFADLNGSDLDPNPFKQFEKWFQQAIDTKIDLPDAMTLATATKDGKPSARIVLLKDFDERGFVFYTNYESRKGMELAENPKAALVFYWAKLDRQVCITGQVSKVSRQESESYFRSRPLGSRLAAWASRQSQVIESREVLENRLKQLMAEYHIESRIFSKSRLPILRLLYSMTRRFLTIQILQKIFDMTAYAYKYTKYQDKDIPMPPYWGGFRLSPNTIEFWQGRPNRLHDRFHYTRQPDNSWLIQRLSP